MPPFADACSGAAANGTCPPPEVPLVRQVDDYDCGLACAAMVVQCVALRQGARCPVPPPLPDQPQPPTLVPRQPQPVRRGGAELWTREYVYTYYKRSSGDNRSLWTIDIFFLLYQLLSALGSPPPSYTTSVLGCRPDYASHAFYHQDYGDDKQRVTRLFAAAAGARLQVEKGRLTTSDLVAMLSSGQVVLIVLLDARVLPQLPGSAALLDLGDRLAAAASAFCCCLPRVTRLLSAVATYQGHYVLAKGFDHARQQVLYANPSARRATSAVPLEVFERARGVYGTDDDVIVVRLTETW
eukprot:TRINITY_DN56790_c0_g1_i1.p1 TRINITY_DN56790_c0_g1~~TRINITY_DN56790_c0_g1_i1.p1  ORF type:complete len:297 (+),score=45.69 TRINITY_DN56790_c0_g1_i1:123-1013(+)